MTALTLISLIAVTLGCWWLLLPFVNQLNLPIENTQGIISYLVVHNRSPKTNLAIYLLLFLLPTLAVFLLEFLVRRNLHKRIFPQRVHPWYSRVTQRRFLFPIVLWIAIAAWITTIYQPNPLFFTEFSKDGFHFGEKVGLSELFLQNPANFFKDAYVLIHGFGLNVLPGAIGLWLGSHENDIAIAVSVVSFQTIISVVFSFLILGEIASYLSKQHQWKIFLILILIYLALYQTVFNLQDRDTIFLVQAFLAIRWLRLVSATPSTDEASYPGIKYPILTGAFLPIGLLYVYDRAVYSIASVLALGVYLLITTPKSYFLKSVLAIVAASSLTSLVLSIWLGIYAIPTAISQVVYWSKVTGLFTALPYPEIEVSLDDILNWLSILLQSITLTLLGIDLRNQCFINKTSIKVFLREKSIPIFMLLLAVLFMRVALGRSDSGHIPSPGFFSVFAFVATIGHIFVQQNRIQIPWVQLCAGVAVAAIFVDMNSVMAAVKVSSIWSYPASLATANSLKSDALIAKYYNAANKIRPELNNQSCFYTLTSEGLWYRALSMSPCSKYWYLIYSTTPETQQALVDDLEQAKPRIILYTDPTGFINLDEVPKETSHLLVHQYIWQQYRPYKLIDGNWFWIRREKKATVSELLASTEQETLGSFDLLSIPADSPLFTVRARGWVLPFAGQSSEEKTVLLTYSSGSPEKLSLLGLTRASLERSDVAVSLNRVDAINSGWQITFNRLNLPDKSVKIRAWAYNSTDQKFYPFSQEKTLRLRRCPEELQDKVKHGKGITRFCDKK